MPSSPDAAGLSARPRASIVGAFLEGWRRVLGAPVLTLGILSATFLTALPLGIVASGRSSTPSRIEPRSGTCGSRDGTPSGPASSPRRPRASARTFTHEILGFGGTLAALSGFLDARPLDPAIAGSRRGLRRSVGVSVRRHSRSSRAGRPVRPSAFFAACGVYFSAVPAAGRRGRPCYWAALRWLHPWLFGTLYDRWTRDLDAEHQVVAVRVGALRRLSSVASWSSVSSPTSRRFARSSRIGAACISALGASIRFIRRRPAASCWRSISSTSSPPLVIAAPLAADGAVGGRARLARAARRRRSTSWPASGPSSRSWPPRSCSSRANSRTRPTPPRRSPSGRIRRPSRRSRTSGE